MSLIGYSYCISAILQGLGSVPDGVDKLKGLIEAVFCFEPIRDKTLSSLLVKFEQWALGVSELSFWLQVVDVWLLVTWGRCRDVDGLLMHKLHVCELLIYFVLMNLNLTDLTLGYSYMNESVMVNISCNECVCIDNRLFLGYYVLLISNIYIVSMWMIRVGLLVAKSIYSFKLCVGICSP